MRKNIFISIVLFIVAGVLVVNCVDKKARSGDEATYNDSLQQSIARGDYFVNHVAACFDCHSKRDFNSFAGPIVEGSEGMGGALIDHNLVAAIPGALYPKNITPDSTTGIGSWSDDDLIKAITQGISKNGDTLFPLMPYPQYNKLPKQDVLDIIAYLRTVKPINNNVPERNLFIPISAVYPPNLQKTIDQNLPPDKMDKIKYGAYLVNMADCATCHTPMNEKGQQGELFTGGLTFTTPAFTVNSANLTPDSLTGIGAWSEQMFVDKFKSYREKEGYQYNPGKKNTMMPWTLFSKMQDDDLKAIYAYLRTLKPVKNKIEKWPGEMVANK